MTINRNTLADPQFLAELVEFATKISNQVEANPKYTDQVQSVRRGLKGYRTFISNGFNISATSIATVSLWINEQDWIALITAVIGVVGFIGVNVYRKRANTGE